MNMRRVVLAFSLAAISGTGIAQPVVPQLGISSTPGNAVVGMWQMNVSIGPCANPAQHHEFLALETFNFGGTLSGTDTHPSSEEGGTEGVWSYDWRARRYAVHMQFPRFVNDVYDGLQDIYIVNIDVSLHGQNLTGDVLAYARNVDNSVRVELCGSVTGQRVDVDL